MIFNSETAKNNAKLLIDNSWTVANTEDKIEEVKETLDKLLNKDTNKLKTYLIYIINPMENIFYLFEYSRTHEKLLKRKLNKTSIMELPNQFVEYEDYIIEKGTILELKDILDIGQWKLSQMKTKKLKIIRVKNKNMESSLIQSYYDFYLYDYKYTSFFKINNLLYLNRGDIENGEKIKDRIISTKDIKLKDDALIFETVPNDFKDIDKIQKIIMFDNYLKKYYRLDIFNGYYTLTPEPLEHKESYNLYIKDEGNITHDLFLNNQRLFFK